ncbi:PAS domain S-box protein [Herbaspirillum sp. HC18]|nr:PAS domain S-box protein [Herbaspirillum sp. HC18]
MDKQVATEAKYLDSVPNARLMLAALLTGAGYYIGTRVGFALTFEPNPISILWPPNAILLAALLVTPTSWWMVMLCAAFPAHLAAQTQSGVPIGMVLGWFVSNCSEALIGAALLRKFVPERIRFDSTRHVILFLFLCVFLGPFLSSFLDAAFVRMAGWGDGGYWQLWSTRFFSNVLSILAFTPVLLLYDKGFSVPSVRSSWPRGVEGVLWALALLVAIAGVFINEHDAGAIAPQALYAPLPILLWAAVRFNPKVVGLSFLSVTGIVIWGAVHGQGPFVGSSAAQNALSIQIFLIGIAVPLFLLAAEAEERRKVQEQLRRKQEKLGLALDAARMGTWEWDIRQDHGNWSSEPVRMFGTRQGTPGDGAETLSGMLHPDDRAATLRALHNAVRNGLSYESEFRILRPDGEVRWAIGKGAVLRDDAGDPVRMVGINFDITDRKHAETSARQEAALRESEERFRQMADAIPQIVWSARPDGYIDYANRKWQELTKNHGQPEGDDSWLPFLHPEDRRRCTEQWHAALSTPRIFEIEYRLLFPDWDAYRWHLVRAAPVLDDAGNIVRWYGTSTDIDDRKNAEYALQAMRDKLEQRVAERTSELRHANEILKAQIGERIRAEEAERMSEARFSKVFRLSPDAMFVSCGVEGRILDVNDRWVKLFGYERAEVIGKNASELNLYANEPGFHAVLERCKACGFIRDVELEIRSKTGALRQVICSGEPILFGDEAGFIGSMRDVTEQRQAEHDAQRQREELAHLTRVVLLGELSGALAHELNQPLTAILINAQTARRLLARDPCRLDEIRDILDEIVDEDKRAGEIIRRLRALFMKGEPKLQPLDINEVVHEALDLAHADLIARNVAVKLDLDSRLARVNGDRVQLQQVFLNLIINACEAMNANIPSGRRLVFTTGTTTDRHVQILVSDTGSGIAANAVDQLFESFFTTKVHGLGLGLSISGAIVTEHGGRIEASNNPGGGATFRVILPALPAQSESYDEQYSHRISGG